MITITLWFLLFLASTELEATYAHSSDGNARCGTPDFTPAVINRIMDIPKKKKARIQAKALPSIVTIDTYFCIVTADDGTFDVPDSVLEDQITVLNDSFTNSGSRFRFALKTATRRPLTGLTADEILSKPLDEYKNDMALFCRQGGFDAFNVFVVPNIDSIPGPIGVAQPYFATGVDVWDGLYVLNIVLPGQGYKYFDHGLTVVHEIGHWLGLIHPFQASSPLYDDDRCNKGNLNDYIDDTPQMNSSSMGCPAPGTRDSCPLLPGFDPTDNFMDYGYDYDDNGRVCLTRFTPQQVARMDNVWEFYRLQSDICALDEFQFVLKILFGNNPSHLAWTINYINGTAFHSSIPDGFGNTFDDIFKGRNITVHHCFPRSERYIFTMYSHIGKGIASPGYFAVYIDNRLLARGGQDFTYSKSITFGAATPPIKKPGRKPTRKPARKPTRKLAN